MKVVQKLKGKSSLIMHPDRYTGWAGFLSTQCMICARMPDCLSDVVILNSNMNVGLPLVCDYRFVSY